MNSENIENMTLEEKIIEIKKRIEKRNANPEWQEICTAIKQLRETSAGKVLARKLIQGFLEREKQNTRQ